MPKIPPKKARELIRILENLGFVQVRQKGSHKHYRHPDGRGKTDPFHKRKDLPPKMVSKIARDIDVPVEEFLDS